MLDPELREFAPDDRARELGTAGEARFDTIEAVGLQLAELQASPSGRNRSEFTA